MAKKAPNYTPEQEQRIAAVLKSTTAMQEAIAELADEFGKSVASVRQKAVRMGLYKKPEYVSKTGHKPRSKAAIVDSIAKSLGVPSESAESLEKANKAILEKLETALSEKAEG